MWVGRGTSWADFSRRRDLAKFPYTSTIIPLSNSIKWTRVRFLMATVEQGDAVVLDIFSDASMVSMFLHQTFGVTVQSMFGVPELG